MPIASLLPFNAGGPIPPTPIPFCFILSSAQDYIGSKAIPRRYNWTIGSSTADVVAGTDEDTIPLDDGIYQSTSFTYNSVDIATDLVPCLQSFYGFPAAPTALTTYQEWLDFLKRVAGTRLSVRHSTNIHQIQSEYTFVGGDIYLRISGIPDNQVAADIAIYAGVV